MCLNSVWGHEQKLVSHCKFEHFCVCAEHCCLSTTLSSVDASVQTPRGCPPSSSDQALFATFIQFLHCSDVEALTWKRPTPGCDLMFNHPQGFDAPCWERALMENPPLMCPFNPTLYTHTHTRAHSCSYRLHLPITTTTKHCTVGLGPDV